MFDHSQEGIHAHVQREMNLQLRNTEGKCHPTTPGEVNGFYPAYT